MLRKLTVLCFVLFTSPSFSQQDIDELISQELPALLSSYRFLHANPELSGYEEKTSAFVAKELKALGFEVTERFGRYEQPNLTCYGVVAIMKNGTGPTVLVRTDLDALPVEEKTGLSFASKVKTRTDSGDETVVMHACGSSSDRQLA